MLIVENMYSQNWNCLIYSSSTKMSVPSKIRFLLREHFLFSFFVSYACACLAKVLGHSSAQVHTVFLNFQASTVSDTPVMVL